jgi:DNA-binding beta-propeller fold protein YncE
MKSGCHAKTIICRAAPFLGDTAVRLLACSLVTLMVSSPAWAIFADHVTSFGPGVEGGAEIAAFDSQSQRLFVTNSDGNTLDVYNLSNVEQVQTLPSIALSGFGDGPNSVAAHNGIVAVAVEADPAQDPGVVVFFDATDGSFLSQVTVGALPDMLTFTPDGSRVLVANEGEPDDDYMVDPEGTVSIIDISSGVASATVTEVSFAAFNVGQPRNNEVPAGLRIFGPGASVAQDLEPEYIAIDDTGTIAYVALQENNGMAIVDILAGNVISLVDFGSKDHSLFGNALDASNRDDAINIRNWPVRGFYQPDAIATLTHNGEVYVLSANEGDARDYDGFSEEFRIGDFNLDPTAFPDAANLLLDENLGRLRTTDQNGDIDNDGDFDELYSYGARSFSVWSGSTGQLLWDSGDEFERRTAQFGLPFFNVDDNRSDDKGPEPEGVDLVTVDGTPVAAIGLERTGGFFLYDMSNPTNPQIINYVPSLPSDEAPEGVLGVEAGSNGEAQPWLIVTHEDSGTIALYRLFSSQAVPTLDYRATLIFVLMLLASAAMVLRRRV